MVLVRHGGADAHRRRSTLRAAFEASRVILPNGTWQTGKTTLALRLAEEFLQREGRLGIDEVQRGGDDLLTAMHLTALWS